MERKIAVSALLIMACILIPAIVQPAKSAVYSEDPTWAGAAAFADAFPPLGVLAGPVGTVGPCPGFAGAFALAVDWAPPNLAIGYGSGSAFCCSNGWNILTATAFAMVVGRGIAWGFGWAACQCTIVVWHRFAFNIRIMLKVHGNAIAHFNYTAKIDTAVISEGTAEWDGAHLVTTGDWFGIPWEIDTGMNMAMWPRLFQKGHFDAQPPQPNLVSNFTTGSRVQSFDDVSWACAKNDIAPIASPYPPGNRTGGSSYPTP